MGRKYLIRCRSLYQEVDAFLDGQMSAWNRFLVRMHLAMCSRCRIYLRQYQRVCETTSEVTPSDLPEDFEQVMSRVFLRWKEEDPA